MRHSPTSNLTAVVLVAVLTGCGGASSASEAPAPGGDTTGTVGAGIGVPTDLADVNATGRALASSAAAAAPSPTSSAAPSGAGKLVVVSYFGDTTHRHAFNATCWEVQGMVNVAAGFDLKVTVDGESLQTNMGPESEGGDYAFIRLTDAAAATGPEGLTATQADPWPNLEAGASWSEDGQNRGITAPQTQYLESVTIEVSRDYQTGSVKWSEPPSAGEKSGWSMTWSCA